jgi:hypothetical protein
MSHARTWLTFPGVNEYGTVTAIGATSVPGCPSSDGAGSWFTEPHPSAMPANPNKTIGCQRTVVAHVSKNLFFNVIEPPFHQVRGAPLQAPHHFAFAREKVAKVLKGRSLA